MTHDKHLTDSERAHSGQPGAKVRHGQDATGKISFQAPWPGRPTSDSQRVTIHHHPDYDEYRVPNPGEKGKGAGYFTNDKGDAEDTARAIHGPDIQIVHRSKRYNTE